MQYRLPASNHHIAQRPLAPSKWWSELIISVIQETWIALRLLTYHETNHITTTSRDLPRSSLPVSLVVYVSKREIVNYSEQMQWSNWRKKTNHQKNWDAIPFAVYVESRFVKTYSKAVFHRLNQPRINSVATKRTLCTKLHRDTARQYKSAPTSSPAMSSGSVAQKPSKINQRVKNAMKWT